MTPGAGVNYRSGALQQCLQAAALVERDQVVAAADMGRADEHLRHAAPPGERHHRVALTRVQINADIIDLDHAALLRTALARAIGADLVVYIFTLTIENLVQMLARPSAAASQPDSHALAWQQSIA